MRKAWKTTDTRSLIQRDKAGGNSKSLRQSLRLRALPCPLAAFPSQELRRLGLDAAALEATRLATLGHGRLRDPSSVPFLPLPLI